MSAKLLYITIRFADQLYRWNIDQLRWQIASRGNWQSIDNKKVPNEVIDKLQEGLIK